ncbi:tail spike protein [Vibrio phage pYD21-A]|uniref:tail spike protein n=1 Tax=Vibrio phage pYD21-A TaxID=754049 RepID=UPI0002C0F605|nr:tail spike protein [Vibrio phage pYD21-A]AGH16056.1 hypothetical protein VPKG_00019 [Vibrio phage pYD21-A]
MATYDNPRPSSQPIGSTDPAVVKDDLITLDQMVETEETTITTRTGKVRTSLKGITQIINDNIILNIAQVSDPLAFVNGTFDYTFTGFNASTSAIYVYSQNGTFPNQLLIPGVDYTFVDNVTSTITLTSSWDGGVLIAKSFDPLGIGNVPYEGNSFTRAELVARGDLNNGDIVYVTDYGNVRCKIQPVGYVAEVGDFTIGTGQIAQILPNSNGHYLVTYFGAIDDPDDELGNQLSYFSLAAQRADITKTKVLIPPGTTYRLSGTPLTYDITWIFGSNADIKGVGGVSPTFVLDLTILGGRVEYELQGNARSMKYMGDGTFRYQKTIGRGQTSGLLSVCATNGATSLMSTACTSFSSAQTSADGITISTSSKLVCDNPDVPVTGWAGYDEGIIVDTAHPDSNCIARETAICNQFPTCYTLEPYSTFADATGLSVGHGISAGLVPWTGPISAFMYWTRTSNLTKIKKGLVIGDSSIEDGAYLAEAIALPDNCGFSWYNPTDNNMSAYVKYLRDSGQNVFKVGVFNDNNTSVKVLDVKFNTVTYGSSTVTLGEDDKRFLGIKLVNSPDVSSDETKKQQRGSLNEAEKTAALQIARAPKIFKWLSEINIDGEDHAKLHCSPMAQTVWSIFIENGLDPAKYGFIKNASSNWSIKPQELLWMICAAQQEKIDNFESRLAALENANG